ncbi:MAG: FadR/GntR family transcriptional regulator [Candidatus Sumerlaeia bacterium]
MEIVKRVSTSEAIVEHLVNRIRRGDYAPGEQLPSERLMQAELGVGRLSLREGLARLSALGIIRVDHGKGAFVQEHLNSEILGHALVPMFPDRDSKRLQDLVDARSLIEGELAAQAAKRRTDDDIVKLREILEVTPESVEDDRSLAELDFSFHREVARIADNAFLMVMLEALSNHIRSFLMEYARSQGNRKSAIERHRPIMDAIINQDPDAARDAARMHIDVCKSSLDNYIEKRKKQQS